MLITVSAPAKKIAHKYRVYGNISLEIEEIKFVMYCEADDFIANDIYYGLEYELEEFRLIKALVKKAKRFVDIGANTGIFSVFAGKVNPELSITALEPHPGNYRRLLKNAALNKAKSRNLPLAAGNKETEINFSIPADESIATVSSANENFTRNFNAIEIKTIAVKQITLDSLFASETITSSDLIKIDVEYYEPEVLEGAIQTLRERKPLLLLEVLSYNKLIEQFPEMKDKISPDHERRIQNILSAAGYSAYQLLPTGVKHVISVTEPHERRNFLFAPVMIPDELILYSELSVAFSSLQ
jgi:FkbM family methyltransferase